MYILEKRNAENILKDLLLKNTIRYQFVFRCNHNITNIQYRELLELLKLHTKTKRNEKYCIEYVTKDHMLEVVRGYMTDMCIANHEYNNIFSIEKDYQERFLYTVVLEVYHTSCSVFVPKTLNMDLKKICSESGYIYMVGRLAFSLATVSASYVEIKESLQLIQKEVNRKACILPFDKEHFSYENMGFEDDFKNHGLADLRIDGDKYYFQDISIANAIKRLFEDKDFSRWLVRESEYDENTDYYWIYREESFVDRKEKSALKCMNEQNSFFQCVQARYINHNPCYLFDTDHPAWNNTLISHSFVCAMINIGRGSKLSMPYEKRLKILDPMNGSGTVCIEALKFQEVTFCGGDISHLSSIMVNDNLIFFQMKNEILKKFTFTLKEYLIQIKKTDWFFDIDENFTKLSQRNQYAFEEVFEELLGEFCNYLIKLENIEKNPEYIEYVGRLLLYLYRKAFLKNEKKLLRKKEMSDFHVGSLLKKYVYDEIYSFYCRVKQYLLLKENQDNHSLIPIMYPENIDCLIEGIDLQDFLKIWQNENNKVDMIITDPPYGVNTGEKEEELYRIYKTFIIQSLKCLKDKGQIIICLLSEMHQGQKTYNFIKREYIEWLFRKTAYENNMELVVNDTEIREEEAIFCFPFYWESKRALKREVIRFEIRKK